LKNEFKIFLSIEAYEKGGPALKWSLLEHITFIIKLISPYNSSWANPTVKK